MTEPYTTTVVTYRPLTQETLTKIHRALDEQGDLGIWIVDWTMEETSND
jgi:hypothetical protein